MQKKDNISCFCCNFAADITLFYNNLKKDEKLWKKDSRSSLFVS